MFNSLFGTITGKFPQKLFLTLNGIEWDITAPDSTLDALPPVGSDAKVYVWLQHTDAAMCLFGFASENDRQIFFDLLKVDGIGPKAAVKILGNVSSKRFLNILETGDVDALQKVPGVGKKTAQKILLQLKGKLRLDAEVASVSASKEAKPFVDVINALVDMGYDRVKADGAVEKIYAKLKDDESFIAKSASQKEDTVFRSAIVELS